MDAVSAVGYLMTELRRMCISIEQHWDLVAGITSYSSSIVEAEAPTQSCSGCGEQSVMLTGAIRSQTSKRTRLYPASSLNHPQSPSPIHNLGFVTFIAETSQ
ncbi:hypothetical protein Moror_4124 [Moniliophthora roreri MCA 2997]|uniref:Uncharacterized protein n=1 Tax=Moniliophthora roreri (strain MCA 2997) TaxID=1381753 RepID=V2YGA3_MONRO|nr:hypothetical protein Moror_4124 [Moniliophthora roreri MCA 2997]